MKQIQGGVTAAKGFEAAGTAAFSVQSKVSALCKTKALHMTATSGHSQNQFTFQAMVVSNIV